VLTINVFLLQTAEPVLVDTGAGAVSNDVLDALSSLLQPHRLRWIWVTHDDLDHTGSLDRLLDLAPQARLVLSSSTVTRTQFKGPLPADRLHLISPGERLHVGDRTLGALQPPLFDSPATTGLFDQRSGVLFSSDCFGATLPGMAEAAVRSTAELAEDTVAEGLVSWAHSDSPWVTLLDEDAFAQVLHRVRRLQPTTILSAHLAPIPAAQVEQAITTLGRAARAEPAAGLTTSQLESLLPQFEPGG
jgi:glyoxylase-like metal-dependent hydrolase (beta-lactamase superfamily II)